MRIVMDDGYCATTVMDGGGSRKRKWKGRGTEVWRKRGKVCRCLAFRHIFSVSRQSLMLEVVPPRHIFSFPPDL